MLGRRHTVRAHFWQSLANYTQQASGLVLGVVLARILSPENFGEFAYATAVVGLFLLPASWSLAPQVVSEIAVRPEVANDALWVTRRIVLARSALAVAACVFLAATLGARAASLGAVIAVPQAGAEFVAVMRATLEGRGQFKVNFYDSLLTAGCTALFALPAAWLGAGTWALALPALPLIAGQLWLYTKCSGTGLAALAPYSGRSYFRSGFTLWVASMGEGALFRADKFLLGKYSSMSGLGDYNRAFNYTPLSARVMNSLLTNPTVAGLAKTSDPAARARLIGKSAALLFAGGALNFALFWWFSGPLVPWVFGPQWVSAVPVFEAMAPMSLAMSLAYLPTTIVLAERKYALLATVRVVSLAAFLVCAALLRSQLDAVHMAWLVQGSLALQGVLLVAGRMLL